MNSRLLVLSFKGFSKLFDFKNKVKLFREDTSHINSLLGQKTDLQYIGQDFRKVFQDFDLKIKEYEDDLPLEKMPKTTTKIKSNKIK